MNWSSSLITGISGSATSLLPTRGGSLRPLKLDTFDAMLLALIYVILTYLIFLIDMHWFTPNI